MSAETDKDLLQLKKRFSGTGRKVIRTEYIYLYGLPVHGRAGSSI